MLRRAVANECELFVVDHIARRQSFAVETTLRTAAAIEQARLAQKQGFEAEIRFVATGSADENVLARPPKSASRWAQRFRT